MMRRTRYKVEIKKNQSFALNITSMTDMFTILLVFLLQSFAASQVEIQPVEGLRVPTSTSDKNPVEGIRISLSSTALRIDSQTVVELKDKIFSSDNLDAHDANFIKPLFAELSKLNEKFKTSKDQKLGKILLQADESISYATLRKVMYTASMAGFPNVKLVTMVGN